MKTYVDDVSVTVTATRERLRVLEARGPDPHGPDAASFQAVALAVANLLGQAEQAASGKEPTGNWLDSWWRGRHLELAYPLLHAAQIQLIDLYDENDVNAAIPQTLASARQYLNRDDPRRVTAEHLPTMKPGPGRRSLLRTATQAAFYAADTDHRQQRTFRNALISSTLLLSLFLLAFLAFLFGKPTFAPLCFQSVQQAGVRPLLAPTASPIAPGTASPQSSPTIPTRSTDAAATSTATSATSVAATSKPTPTPETELVTAERTINCPTGSRSNRASSGWDVVMVAILGMVGGALSAIVAIRGMQITTSPYDVPLALSVLKLPTGALFAVIGILAIKANFVPGLSALDSQEQILAYAVVLGYAQQLVTGILDRRAGSLGKAEPHDAPPGLVLPDEQKVPDGNDGAAATPAATEKESAQQSEAASTT